MKKMISLACLAILLFSGCKKEDNCNLTAESLIGTYRLDGLIYRASASHPEQDLYNDLDECKKDDVFIFNSNGSFFYRDGGVQCFFPVNETSTWRLSGTTLEFDGSVNNVTDFDCNNMTTTYYDQQGGILTARYIRQ